MTKYFSILFLSVCFYSCVKDKPQSAIQPVLQLSGSKKVYVVNEGGFGYNQASVSLYDPGTLQASEDFYKQQNNAVLGDVAQSISFINGSYFIVVNNSNKIIVCDASFKKTAQITDLSSPRYIQPVTNKKAYVSDYSANAISIIDLNTKTKTGSIACSGWTEKMVLIYNKVFVTNMRKKYLYVINSSTDLISDSIFVGLNAGNIVLDKDDKIWVLSSGDQATNEVAKLSKINPITTTVETIFSFSDNSSPGNLCLNATKDTLYFLNEGIYRLAVSDAILPASPFIDAGNKNFYGLGVSPNHKVYASDVLDYTQRSNIYIYNSKGEQQSFFKAGIISNGFYFE